MVAANLNSGEGVAEPRADAGRLSPLMAPLAVATQFLGGMVTTAPWLAAANWCARALTWVGSAVSGLWSWGRQEHAASSGLAQAASGALAGSGSAA